jgi:hypothetical protein
MADGFLISRSSLASFVPAASVPASPLQRGLRWSLFQCCPPPAQFENGLCGDLDGACCPSDAANVGTITPVPRALLLNGSLPTHVGVTLMSDHLALFDL